MGHYDRIREEYELPKQVSLGRPAQPVAPPKLQVSVATELKSLGEVLSSAEERLQQLVSALEPVLEPATEANGCTIAQDPGSACEVVNRLMNFHYRLRILTTAIHEAGQRLQL